jgi:two-component system, chemotaxis family, protein-glutamate methylesterase/glutaminase
VPKDLIAIGASAGGFTGLLEIVSGLPADFPATVFVVIHTSADNPGLLPQILARSGKLPAVYATNGDRIKKGLIYVAAPDHHLFVHKGRVCSARGPRENGFRPAIDPLFRSLARDFGERVIGVVLSGARDDGAYGLAMIKEAGGTAIVQDPDRALVPNMPLSALAATSVDFVLPVERIASVLIQVVSQTASSSSRASAMAGDSNDQKLPDAEITDPAAMPGEATMFTCPECGGTLWELERGKTLRYRCHVGHKFGADSLVSDKDNAVEAAMWHALRALHEQAALRRSLAGRARGARMVAVAENYERQAEDADARAQLIRNALARDNVEEQAPQYEPESATAERDS